MHETTRIDKILDINFYEAKLTKISTIQFEWSSNFD